MSKNRCGIDRYIAPLIIFSVFAILGTVDLAVGDWGQRKNSELYYAELQKLDYIVLEGIIESPSVIIVEDTFAGFVRTARDLHQDTVYHCCEPDYPRRSSFYAFNDDLTIAWKYTPKGGYNGGEL